MKINELAKLSGVTVRTLHYYDEIGLLKPSDVSESGHRLYDELAMETLQQILFFRELDFPLSDIKEIMTNPEYDKSEALMKQKELLMLKRNRLDNLIVLLENSMNGDVDMSFKQFDMKGIEDSKKKYAAEVKERWGQTAAYVESEEKTNGYDEAQWKFLAGEGEALLRSFGKIRNMEPEGEEGQALVKTWQDYITNNFYTCTNEILSGLGLMYIGDERFTQNIDKYGVGTAKFMAAAIAIYCKK